MTEGHYRAGSGEPLVLVHGATMSWRVWRPILDQLAKHYDVHAVTMPGHLGGEPLADSDASIDTFADGVERYLDAAGLETAHLAGQSLGGAAVVELLRRGRARSVVSFAGPSAWSDDSAIKRLRRLFVVGNVLGRLHFLNSLGLRSAGFRKRLLAVEMQHGERVTRDQYADMVKDSRFATFTLSLVKNTVRQGPRQPVDAGDVPVVFAWGTEDKIVPLESFGRASHALVDGAELRLLEGVGHQPVWDDPDAVILAIRDATSRATVV